MAGMLMFVLGLFKLGVLIRYIPVSIVIGFTNGIAVLIALSQLRDLMGLAITKMPGEFFAQLAALAGAIASFNPHAFGIGLVCVAGLALWPRLFTPGRPIPAGRIEPSRCPARAQNAPGLDKNDQRTVALRTLRRHSPSLYTLSLIHI